MKLRFQNISSAFLPMVLLVLLLANCVDDSADSPLAPFITGSLVAVSECGGFPERLLPALPPDQSGVEWFYDGEGTLRLSHINAAFNCCPKISCRITEIGNTITIKEIDEGMCDCLCLTDAVYGIRTVSPGTYTIRFDEPYLEKGEQLLEFSITLGTEPSGGDFVVDRNHYPWHPPDPEGTLADYSTCGGFDDPRFPDEPPADSNCFVWEYDDNLLSLRHTNAVFNCCVEALTAVIVVTGDRITITEGETGESMCFCICLYDLDMDIFNLPPGVYQVTVFAPYREHPIEFVADLLSQPDGYYCYGTGMEPE